MSFSKLCKRLAVSILDTTLGAKPQAFTTNCHINSPGHPFTAARSLHQYRHTSSAGNSDFRGYLGVYNTCPHSRGSADRASTSACNDSQGVLFKRSYYTYSHEPFHPLKREPKWQSPREAVSIIKSGEDLVKRQDLQ